MNIISPLDATLVDADTTAEIRPPGQGLGLYSYKISKVYPEYVINDLLLVELEPHVHVLVDFSAQTGTLLDPQEYSSDKEFLVFLVQGSSMSAVLLRGHFNLNAKECTYRQDLALHPLSDEEYKIWCNLINLHTEEEKDGRILLRS